MTPPEWKERYIARLVVKAGFTYREAEDTLNAGEYDCNDNPEDAADTEASFWGDSE